MSRGLRGGLRAGTDAASRVWARVPMRTQGRITVGLPLLAMLVSTCLAVVGNYQRHDIEADIQRKFEMSGALGELTTLMVNAETGMRGYLVTGQGEFLEPFDQATAELPSAMGKLTDLATAEPGEKPRIEKLARIGHLKTLTGEQLADLAWQRDHVTPGGGGADVEIRAHMAYGKDLMDQIRVEVDAMQGEERALLDERIADINAIRVRDYVSVVLALVVALVTRFVAWYLFKKGTLLRVEQLTENVRRRREGRPSAFPARERDDALGRLEREIRLLETAPDPSPEASPPSSPERRSGDFVR